MELRGLPPLLPLLLVLLARAAGAADPPPTPDPDPPAPTADEEAASEEKTTTPKAPAEPPRPELPDSWSRCLLTDPNFDLCLRDAVQSALPQLAQGAATLGAGPLEPLALAGAVAVAAVPGRVHLALNLSAARVHGLSQAKVVSVFNDLPKGLLDMHVMLPWLMLQADFEAEGQVLKEPVKGKGHVNITLYGAEAFFGLSGARAERGDRHHLHVEAARLDIVALTGLRTRLAGLDAAPERDEQLNALLESQSKSAWSVLRPRLQTALAAALRGHAARLFDRVALEDIFLGEEHPAVRDWRAGLQRLAEVPQVPEVPQALPAAAAAHFLQVADDSPDGLFALPPLFSPQ